VTVIAEVWWGHVKDVPWVLVAGLVLYAFSGQIARLVFVFGVQGLSDVIYANGQFLVVGTRGQVFTSSDGRDWTKQTLHSKADLSNVIFEHGTYFASAFNWGFTSCDGATWAKHRLPFEFVESVTAGGGNFYVTGSWLRKDSELHASQDAVNWTKVLQAKAASLEGCEYGDGILILYKEKNMLRTASAGPDHSVLMMTKDGQTWREQPAPIEEGPGILQFRGGRFFLIDPDGHVFTSGNGERWESVAPIAGLRGGARVTHGEGVYVMATFEGKIYSSSDASVWYLRFESDSRLDAVAFGNGTFVAVGGKGRIVCSPDGQTWTVMHVTEAKPVLAQ
jgi:hypothetical protein